MSIRIVNVTKFLRSILIITGIIVSISLIISNRSLSHGDTTYKLIIVEDGETLWSIAKQEKKINNLYHDKDIRDIVDSLKKVNSLSNGSVYENQKLIIPEI